MERPTTKAGYTAKDLRDYALYRKNAELTDIKRINTESIRGEVEKHDDYRNPLEITESKEVLIRLSWGGDGDGFKLSISKDGEIKGGVYFWEDWGVYEEIKLTQGEAEKVAEFYKII